MKQSKQAKATKVKAKAKPAAAPAAPPVPSVPEALVNLFGRIRATSHRRMKATLPFTGMRQEAFLDWAINLACDMQAEKDPRIAAVLKLVA